MKRKVTGFFLALVLLLSLCLVVVTPVVADDVKVAHTISISGQFEDYAGYPFGMNGVITGTIEVLDDGTVKGYIYSFYIVNSIFAASWQRQEVIEAAIVEVDSKQAVWTLNRTVAFETMLPFYPPFPVTGKYWAALIVDGDNPGSGEDYILGMGGIQDETEAKSVYDNYLATGDASGLSHSEIINNYLTTGEMSGLSRMDIANCNVLVK